MRVAELSNHPDQMLNAATTRRQNAEQQALARYDAAFAGHQARLRDARRRRDQARTQRRWFQWLRWTFAASVEKRRAPARPVLRNGPTDEEEMLRAGIAGEQLVADQLSHALDDRWILLHGYHNPRGEIDHLLLGPRGLFAIEVKNRNATVHVDGDTWRTDKYDKYGNLIERDMPFADTRGRSPSQQLNQPADELERFLRQRGQQVEIRRIVLLAHPRSAIGTRRNPTVTVGTSTAILLGLIRQSQDRLDPRQVAQIERLIRRDHAYHRTRRIARDSRRDA